MAEQPTDELTEAQRVALGQRRAGAAISLLRLGEVEKSHGAFQIQDDPESLTQFVHRCRDRGVTANELVQSLRSATDVHSRFALLLALGDYPLAEIDAAQRDGLIQELTEAYGSDPSSAIHGATGWLLRKWGFAEEVTKVDHTPLPYDETGKREWYVLEISPKSEVCHGLQSGILDGDEARTEDLFHVRRVPTRRVPDGFAGGRSGSPDRRTTSSGQTDAAPGGEHARDDLGAVDPFEGGQQHDAASNSSAGS